MASRWSTRLGAGDRQSAGGAWRTGQDGGQCAGDEHLLRSELPGPAELVEPILQHRRRVATAGSSDALHHQHQRGSGACGGNEMLAASGRVRRGGVGGFGGAVRELGETATIVAHEGVLTAMSTATGKAPAAPEGALPADTFFDDFHKLSEYVNGEPVILYHAKAANTDGDSFVFFRHSEVIAAGNLFSTISYPLIDMDKGGTDPGRDRRPQSHPRFVCGRVSITGRHVDYPGARTAVGHRRRRVLSQHAGDDSRSDPRSQEAG